MKINELEKIHVLLKDIYNLTNIKSCLYDSDGKELCFYPERLTDFCAYLRKDEKMNEKCIECDRRAIAECKKTHKQCFYTCHAGLLECVSPIILSGNIIGYITIGQIKAEQTSNFSAIQDNFPLSLRKELAKKFEKLPHIVLLKRLTLQ